MTATAADARASTVPATGTGGTRRRGWRLPAALTVLVVLTVTLAVLTQGEPETSTPLDPANPGPDGTRALWRVLGDQGVDTEVARGADDLEGTTVDAGTTVVVSATSALGPSTWRRLRRHAADGDVVVLEPGGPAWRLLGGSGSPAGAVGDGPRQAGCEDPPDLLAPARDLEVVADRATTYPGPGCFPDETGRPTAVAERGVLVLGSATALTNEAVLDGDNAAFGLRLLGAGDRAVWYVPDATDLVGEDAVSLRSLLPAWVGPGLWLGLLAAVALVVWRARRLGPLATEPLPVLVRAAETTHSRGRLYRRAGDRPHAAAALRAAHRDRLGAALGVGRSPAGVVDPVVRAVAEGTGRSALEVAALLAPDGPAPRSDHDLITLAHELDRLEREVRDA